MFPLSDSVKTQKFPFMMWFLILVNTAVFILEITAPNTDVFISHYALIPAQVHFNNYLTLIPFITAIFLHGGFLHILSNMWFLFIFGDNVEEALTPLGFLAVFLLSGIAGNILQYLIMPNGSVPILGASGAIAGILGCYYRLFPYSKVKTLIFVFFFVTVVDIYAPIMLGYWFVLQIISGLGSITHSSADQGGVAFFAHIAGFIIGVIMGNFIKERNKIVTV